MSGLLRFPRINNVVISGRMTRDIDLKYTNNNLPVAKITLAVDHYYKDEFGNQQTQASFIDAVAFGKTAQICQESLKKGSPVIVEGALKTHTYTDQNNQNRKVTEIMIARVYPLERDDNYNSNYSGTQQQNYQENNYSKQQNYQEDQSIKNNTNYEPDLNDSNTEDDLPF
ncbi:MAG: single-stranded DNA-binding protein [Candidatus Cloacimonetes bacterium]|jgi:single-strand DNA-binding protein|nr:single-stranded DNA-binding protein [Candidatus Cloacimonadota bacterium]MDD4154961.1 single-stranded DNA-binding protein [Candidatus Cloacimonadota bacterium]